MYSILSPSSSLTVNPTDASHKVYVDTACDWWLDGTDDLVLLAVGLVVFCVEEYALYFPSGAFQI